jgi:glutamate-1-semialdehyde 2,1-aminomutase
MRKMWRDGRKPAEPQASGREGGFVLRGVTGVATVPEKELNRSQITLERARRVLVGGVDSPVRAFGAVGGAPIIVDRARGAQVWDVDGNSYLDFISSWGALILGHAHPEISAALAEQAVRGTSYGMTTNLEVELAEMIQKAVPSMERVRFVCSGTEATMSAVRLARAATGRNLIVKFEGGYHGHGDSFLVKAGSGLATLGIAASPGVPQALAELTLDAPYNDLSAVERLFDAHPKAIAAVIVEPIAANMGVVPPVDGFLPGLRELTQRHGALLIFDEVITGFRLCFGGAQNVFGIEPDLTTLGKIIGGGLPVAAYGGRRELMEQVAPLGPVYQAGTLSGNPLAMRAGIETLRRLAAPGFYDSLERKGKLLADAIQDALADCRVNGYLARAGSLLTLFFTPSPVENFVVAKTSDTRRFAAFFHEMLRRKVLLPPSQFEALFISASHTDEDLLSAARACHESLAALPS